MVVVSHMILRLMLLMLGTTNAHLKFKACYVSPCLDFFSLLYYRLKQFGALWRA